MLTARGAPIDVVVGLESGAPSKPGGAVVFLDLSAADGQGILRATVVRVRF